MINAEELIAEILEQRNLKPRFRFLMPSADVEKLIEASYIAEVRRRQMNYIERVETKQYIKTLAEATTGENPKFGLLLAGNCGNGKTTLLYALQNAINWCRRRDMFKPIETLDWKVGLAIYDARDIVATNKEAQDSKTDGKKRWDKLKREPMIAIEDLGKEASEVMEYGNILNPVTELLEYRYDAQLFTAITTNLTPRQIREKYGARIADRCNEMMNVIVFENESYRR